MITNLKFKEEETSYACSIGGNSIENELVIMLSPSQAKKTPVLIASIAIDGDIEVVCNKKWVKHGPPLGKLLRETIKAWTHGGIKPTEEQSASLEKQIDKIMKKIDKRWGYLLTRA